jgi:hypothetical protein
MSDVYLAVAIGGAFLGLFVGGHTGAVIGLFAAPIAVYVLYRMRRDKAT